MDKNTFLETLKIVRGQWEKTLAGLDEKQVSQTSASGEMSVIDLVAHVCWYEREMLGVLNQRALAGSEWWGLSPEQRNAEIEKANEKRPWGEVQAEELHVFDQLLLELHALEDEGYTNPHMFRDMPVEWQPWEVLADNTYLHYQHHLDDLLAWQDRSQKME